MSATSPFRGMNAAPDTNMLTRTLIRRHSAGHSLKSHKAEKGKSSVLQHDSVRKRKSKNESNRQICNNIVLQLRQNMNFIWNLRKDQFSRLAVFSRP